MRISRVIATRLIQEAIRRVWAADDALRVGASELEVKSEIEKAKLALLGLIDLVDMPAVDRTNPVERQICEAVHEMLDRITNLLDVPKPRPSKRKRRKP